MKKNNTVDNNILFVSILATGFLVCWIDYSLTILLGRRSFSLFIPFFVNALRLYPSLWYLGYLTILSAIHSFLLYQSAWYSLLYVAPTLICLYGLTRFIYLTWLIPLLATLSALTCYHLGLSYLLEPAPTYTIGKIIGSMGVTIIFSLTTYLWGKTRQSPVVNPWEESPDS